MAGVRTGEMRRREVLDGAGEAGGALPSRAIGADMAE